MGLLQERERKGIGRSRELDALSHVPNPFGSQNSRSELTNANRLQIFHLRVIFFFDVYKRDGMRKLRKASCGTSATV